MQERQVNIVVHGKNTVDGAGVHLVRVLSDANVEEFDPFLMLDSFDSHDSNDYIKGFPMHPHRGIETITYLVHGKIVHEDSLGNQGEIVDGGTQWMTAGSGILHEEMPQATERMLGLQLWLNLPQVDKMTEPKYFDINSDDVVVVEKENYTVRIVSGNFDNHQGVKPHHIQATIYDVTVDPGQEIEIPTIKNETVFIFLLEGDALISEERYGEKSAVLFSEGDYIKVSAPNQAGARFMFFQAPRLDESIAWGGPIVMNTRKELEQAFDDLRSGNFIKKNED